MSRCLLRKAPHHQPCTALGVRWVQRPPALCVESALRGECQRCSVAHFPASPERALSPLSSSRFCASSFAAGTKPGAELGCAQGGRGESSLKPAVAGLQAPPPTPSRAAGPLGACACWSGLLAASCAMLKGSVCTSISSPCTLRAHDQGQVVLVLWVRLRGRPGKPHRLLPLCPCQVLLLPPKG